MTGQTMMQITRAEIIAGDSAHTSISLTVPPGFFEFCNQAVSLMLELTITSASQWSPDIAATVDCLTDITTINHKAPRSLICCNATASWLFRREVFQAKLLAVGIPPTERVLRVRRLIWVNGEQAGEGDWSNSVNSLRLQWRHNHDFWFSDDRYQFPPTTPAYRGTLMLILISLSSSRFF